MRIFSTCPTCELQAELSAERRTRQTRVVEITVTSKICRQCAEKKHVSAFNRNKNNPDGLASYCKPCRSQNEAGARVGLSNASLTHCCPGALTGYFKARVLLVIAWHWMPCRMHSRPMYVGLPPTEAWLVQSYYRHASRETHSWGAHFCFFAYLVQLQP